MNDHGLMMEPVPELKEVCEKLDQTLDGIINTLGEILVCQAELNESIKSGFLMMSKARYTMGLNRISSTQYSEEGLEEATTKIMVKEDDDSRLKFSLLQENGEADNANNSSLRHRKEQKEDLSEEKLTARINHLNINNSSENKVHKESDEVEETKPNRLHRDPLNWFGVLVPQALRQSQSHFKRAIEQSCHLAGLKVHLLKLRTQQDDLIMKKKQLKPGDSSTEGTADEVSGDEST